MNTIPKNKSGKIFGRVRFTLIGDRVTKNGSNYYFCDEMRRFYGHVIEFIADPDSTDWYFGADFGFYWHKSWIDFNVEI